MSVIERSFIPAAEKLIDNGARVHRHEVSELSPDVDYVMSTVTKESELTWARNLCWALPWPDAEGRLKIGIRTTSDDIHAFYVRQRQLTQLTVLPFPTTDLRTDWYVFHESTEAPIDHPATGGHSETDFIALFVLDGSDGISSEIGWGRTAEVALPLKAKVGLLATYLDALRKQDAGALASMFTEGAQGAVRGYFGYEQPFVRLDGNEAIRGYYDRLFGAVRFLEADVVQSLVRDWFVFYELRLKLELLSGERRGDSVQTRIAEYLAMGADGRFAARCGYGTELESEV